MLNSLRNVQTLIGFLLQVSLKNDQDLETSSSLILSGQIDSNISKKNTSK